MTNDELERAMEFLLKSQADSQAKFDAEMERSNERHARLDELIARIGEKHERLAEQVSSFADTQAVIMQVMTRTLESQDEMNNSLRATVRDLVAEQKASDEALRRSMLEGDEALRRRLLEADERFRQAVRELAAERAASENVLRESMREGDEALRQSLRELAAAQARTEKAVARLARKADARQPDVGP